VRNFCNPLSGVKEGGNLVNFSIGWGGLRLETTRWVACYCVIERCFSVMRPLISGLLSYFHVFHPFPFFVLSNSPTQLPHMSHGCAF
jgi:hypothetical protein